MTNTDDLQCWKCGAPITDVPLPLGRYAECLACRAELHVCRMCRFYDERVANACREPVAEPVKDKQRGNFCGYFEPTAAAWRAPDEAPACKSRSELDALFGAGGDSGESEEDPARKALDDLFKGTREK